MLMRDSICSLPSTCPAGGERAPEISVHHHIRTEWGEAARGGLSTLRAGKGDNRGIHKCLLVATGLLYTVLRSLYIVRYRIHCGLCV